MLRYTPLLLTALLFPLSGCFAPVNTMEAPVVTQYRERYLATHQHVDFDIRTAISMRQLRKGMNEE